MRGGTLIRSSSHILVSHQKQHSQTAAGSRCSCQKKIQNKPKYHNIVKHRIHLPLGSLRITENAGRRHPFQGWQPRHCAHFLEEAVITADGPSKQNFKKSERLEKQTEYIINISYMKSDVALTPLSSIQFFVRDNQSSCKVPVQKAAIAGRSVYQGQILQQFLPQYLHPSSPYIRHDHPTFNRESLWWVYKPYPLP